MSWDPLHQTGDEIKPNSSIYESFLSRVCVHITVAALSERCQRGSLAYLTSFSPSSWKHAHTTHIYMNARAVGLSIPGSLPPPALLYPAPFPHPHSLSLSVTQKNQHHPPSLMHSYPPYSLGTQIPISPSLPRSVVFIVVFLDLIHHLS